MATFLSENLNLLNYHLVWGFLGKLPNLDWTCQCVLKNDVHFSHFALGHICPQFYSFSEINHMLINQIIFLFKSNYYFTVCRRTLFYRIGIDMAINSDRLRGNTRYSFMIFWHVDHLSIKAWITDHQKLPEITYRNVTITAKRFVQ